MQKNDIDMLKTAEIGVAMGNAVECVRKCADYVTSDVDNGGNCKSAEIFSFNIGGVYGDKLQVNANCLYRKEKEEK